MRLQSHHLQKYYISSYRIAAVVKDDLLLFKGRRGYCHMWDIYIGMWFLRNLVWDRVKKSECKGLE